MRKLRFAENESKIIERLYSDLDSLGLPLYYAPVFDESYIRVKTKDPNLLKKFGLDGELYIYIGTNYNDKLILSLIGGSFSKTLYEENVIDLKDKTYSEIKQALKDSLKKMLSVRTSSKNYVFREGDIVVAKDEWLAPYEKLLDTIGLVHSYNRDNDCLVLRQYSKNMNFPSYLNARGEYYRPATEQEIKESGFLDWLEKRGEIKRTAISESEFKDKFKKYYPFLIQSLETVFKIQDSKFRGERLEIKADYKKYSLTINIDYKKAIITVSDGKKSGRLEVSIRGNEDKFKPSDAVAQIIKSELDNKIKEIF